MQHPKLNSDVCMETIQETETAFSYFKSPIKNVVPSKSINLTEAHKLILSDMFKQATEKARSLSKPEYKKFKAVNFDYVTFNGIFSKRHDSGFESPSHLFIVDIDGLGDKLNLVRKRLTTDPILAPQLVYVSPSGDGLKIVVRIDISIIETIGQGKGMGNIWEAVNSHFGRAYADLISPNDKNHFIDASGKDLSRACFLCHDPEAYLNINDTILGQAFVGEMQSFVKESGKKILSCNGPRVNPATTLSKLATKHLSKSDNHHPQLIAFIGGAKGSGVSKADTLDFIKRFVHISAESGNADPEKLQNDVDDIYHKDEKGSEGVQYLTFSTFGYDILFFKYSAPQRPYTVTSLHWDAVRDVLHEAGFAKRKIGKGFLYIQKNGCVIKEVTPEIMRDYLTQYVDSIKKNICFNYRGMEYEIPPAVVREIFLKNSNNIFNSVWLEHLHIHDEPILKDTKDEMYFFFKDCLIKVSKEGITPHPLSEVKGFCVWEDQMIPHEFTYREKNDTAHFNEFLKNVTNKDDNRLLTMVTGIGYLMHHHFRESEGQAVVFYDETVTDLGTPMGGSGKGLIVNAIKQVRKVSKVDGKHLDSGNRFCWETVMPSTQVVWLDDVKPDFDFGMLHSNLTDGWTVERKHKSQFLIEPHDSPKTVICSNSIIKGGGTTNKRRQFIIELSDFYSRQIIKGDEKPIETTHNCLFFNKEIWVKNDWDLFFSVMMDCAFQYLNHGLVHYEGINVELNRFRQATDEDFVAWVMEQNFEPNLRYQTQKYFREFVNMYFGETHQIGQRKFTSFIKQFAQYKGWSYLSEQSGGNSYFLFKSI